jgi:hypothetical protein
VTGRIGGCGTALTISAPNWNDTFDRLWKIGRGGRYSVCLIIPGSICDLQGNGQTGRPQDFHSRNNRAVPAGSAPVESGGRSQDTRNNRLASSAYARPPGGFHSRGRIIRSTASTGQRCACARRLLALRVLTGTATKNHRP